MYLYSEILSYINTMSCPIKVNSNTIELIVHTSCYCVSDLFFVEVENLKKNDTKSNTITCIRVKKIVWSDISKCFSHFFIEFTHLRCVEIHNTLTRFQPINTHRGEKLQNLFIQLSQRSLLFNRMNIRGSPGHLPHEDMSQSKQ